MPPRTARPSPADLAAAEGRRLPDLIRPGLEVLFCGINPSLYSAAVQHHFARPGNRFWPTLHAAGFTERVLLPSEQAELLELGIGLTNVVPRASISAAELTAEDYRHGCAQLQRKLRRYRPRVIAFLGLGAYRIAAQQPLATVGPQAQPFAGVLAWALPNPSGLNAHYPPLELARCYAELARARRRPQPSVEPQGAGVPLRQLARS
jgi:double-stranded uracil-DNA glycosylase